MAGAKKTVWDLALEITGQDKGAKTALAAIKANIKDVQDAGKQLGKDFQSFTSNASKLALGVAAGVAAAGAGVIAMANSFATAGDQVAKTADSLGMAIEGYQKLKYAMTDSGLEAGEFDSAIQKMTNTINLGAAGNEAARRQLEGIGLDAAKLASMRPEQAFERIADYMQTLPDDASRAQVAITLFGKTAGPRMAAAMRMGSEGIQQLGAEAESLGIIFSESQARSAEEYGNQLNRLKSSVTGMKNQFIGGAIVPLTEGFKTLRGAMQDQMPMIQELGAKFGEWLGNVISRLPDVIAKLKEIAANVWDNINKVKDFVGGWKNLAIVVGVLLSLKTIISGVKVVISAITFAQTAYNAVLGISKASIVAYKAAQVAAAAAGKGLTVVQWALNAAMAANPIGLIIMAVIALIAGIVLLVKNFDKVKEAFAKIWEGIKEIFGKIGEFFKGVWNGIKEGASKAWNGIKTGASNAWSGIKTGAENLKNGAVNIFNKMREGAGNAFNKAKEFGSAAWENIKDLGFSAWGQLENRFPGLANVISNVFNRIKGIITGVIDSIKNIFNGFKEFFTGLWDSLKQGPTATIEYIKNAFFGLFENIKQKFFGFIDVIKNGWDKVKGFFGGVADGVKNIFGGKNNKMPGHADGGIFTTRHIAEICEKGPEAVIPLDKSQKGFDIWKEAGMLGGYMNKTASQNANKENVSETPPVMAAAASKVTENKGYSINIDFSMTNNFSGSPDNNAVKQIEAAGQKAGDNFEARVKEALENIMRNQRRVSYA